jgi:hypothetical protein
VVSKVGLGTCDIPWGCGNKYINKYLQTYIGVHDIDIGMSDQKCLETSALQNVIFLYVESNDREIFFGSNI